MADTLTRALSESYPGPSLPGPAHIRLVHLQPGTGDAIFCELSTTLVDSAPDYEALSYTWGDPSRTVTINMGTQGSKTTHQFSVTSNCFSALKYLRYKEKPRVLWIDALAIDQSNIDERNHQVSLMPRIYSQAEGVVIHLGKSGKNSDLAIKFIMECDDPSPNTTSLSFPKSEILIQALRDFFLRPWFTRVWVIQEVFLSSEKTVYCGDKELSWSAIENFRHYLVSTRLQFRLPYVISKSSRFAKEEGKVDSMLTALVDSRHCEATDPRDKIYSLLPMFYSFRTPLGLTPRYQDTPAKVYTDWALALIPDEGWNILYAVQGHSSTKNLPSWVPDWSVPPQRQILGTAFPMEMSSFWTHMTPSGVPNKPQIIIRSIDGGQIAVLHGFGYPCGKIVKLGSTYIAGRTTFPAKEWFNLGKYIDRPKRPNKAESKSSNAMLLHQRDLFDEFLGLALFLYSDSIKAEDMGDKLTKPDFTTGRSREAYKDYMFGFRWEESIRKLALERKDGILPFRDIPFHYAAAGWPASYGNTIRGNLEASHSRRLFVTDTGYYGVAPEEAEIGDQLFVCVGAAVPFVLRENEPKNGGNEFHLVGESYLQVGAWYGMVNTETKPQSLYII
jgi:hypothetical protein